MKNISSAEILEGIKNNDRSIIELIYNKYFSTISKFVQNNTGSESDAWDVFQEGIVIVYEQSKTPDFKINNTFITYFYTVCKYRWLKTLRDRGIRKYEFYDDNKELENIGFNSQNNQFDEVAEKERRMLLYKRNLDKISKECQKLLKLMAKGLNVNEITLQLNYKSSGFTYKKRRICKHMLIKKIKQDLNNNQINL